ncbi:MAG: peptidylprolyl isomerase [Nanoarchaeota archaeon]|nr:peptidylprolyl isomerase [Nanoarchaeota archaeon]
MGKKNLSILATVIIALAVIALLWYSLRAQSSEAVARVNGASITEEQLTIALANNPLLSRGEMLEQLINREMLTQEAKKQGFNPSEEEIQQQYTQISLSFPSQQAFEDALKEANLTKEQLLQDMRDRSAITAYLMGAVPNTTVSDEEAQAYYTAHAEEFKAKPGQIHVAHILVATEAEAEAVLNQLEAGADYRKLAANLSLDPTAVDTGGDLGFISLGQTVEEFERAAFRLNTSDVSAPVQTQYGYHIIIRLQDTISYLEASNTVTQLAETEKRAAAVESLLADLRSKTDIVYLVPRKLPFTETDDELCEESGKPVLRMYVSSSCASCAQMETLLQTLAQNDFVVKVWELDTGDNRATVEKEAGLDPEEFAILKKYNSGGAVPAYVLGCKYVRLGNAYSAMNLTAEREELAPVLDDIA